MTLHPWFEARKNLYQCQNNPQLLLRQLVSFWNIDMTCLVCTNKMPCLFLHNTVVYHNCVCVLRWPSLLKHLSDLSDHFDKCKRDTLMIPSSIPAQGWAIFVGALCNRWSVVLFCCFFIHVWRGESIFTSWGYQGILCLFRCLGKTVLRPRTLSVPDKERVCSSITRMLGGRLIWWSSCCINLCKIRALFDRSFPSFYFETRSPPSLSWMWWGDPVHPKKGRRCSRIPFICWLGVLSWTA